MPCATGILLKEESDVAVHPKRILSLFAGIAGLDLGIRLVFPESRTVCFVERESYAASVLVARMEDKTLDEAPIWSDITTFDGKPWCGKVDTLIGGFPCQAFSVAGYRKGFKDPRGNLFYEFVRAADVMKPRWIIGENVKGILSRKNEDKSKFVKDIICEEFEKIGYHMYEPFVLKASDFGVPQKRERCFFVGSLKKHDFTSSWFQQHKAKEVGLKDIVGFSLERALLIQKHDELDDTYENLRDQRLAANKELKKKLPKHRKIIKIILNYTYPLCAEIESLIKDMNDTSEPTESPPTMLKKCFEKKDKHGLSFRTRSSGTFSEIVDIELPTNFCYFLHCIMITRPYHQISNTFV